jgi:hypothetical protein
MEPSPAYQREQRKQTKVDRLVDTWLDHRVGALIVNKVNGKVWIDDGGHRWDAARTRFGPDYELPCIVNENLDGLAESDVFLGVNRDRTSVGKWDEYRVGLKGGHEPYVSIDRALDEHGLKVAQKASAHRIGAVQALLRVEKTWGIAVLSQAIKILLKAFTAQPTTWDADVIQAVARLIGFNASVVDLDRLAEVLGRFSVAQWRTKSMSKPGGSESRSILIAKEIADVYNRRLRPPSRIKATR